MRLVCYLHGVVATGVIGVWSGRDVGVVAFRKSLIPGEKRLFGCGTRRITLIDVIYRKGRALCCEFLAEVACFQGRIGTRARTNAADEGCAAGGQVMMGRAGDVWDVLVADRGFARMLGEVMSMDGLSIGVRVESPVAWVEGRKLVLLRYIT